MLVELVVQLVEAKIRWNKPVDIRMRLAAELLLHLHRLLLKPKQPDQPVPALICYSRKPVGKLKPDWSTALQAAARTLRHPVHQVLLLALE